MLATKASHCENTTFVDVDYQSLMLEKTKIIKGTEQLSRLLGDDVDPQGMKNFLLRRGKYAALSCDLTDINRLDSTIAQDFGHDCMFFVICEVSITYMDPESSNALIGWAATLGNGKFLFNIISRNPWMQTNYCSALVARQIVPESILYEPFTLFRVSV